MVPALPLGCLWYLWVPAMNSSGVLSILFMNCSDICLFHHAEGCMLCSGAEVASSCRCLPRLGRPMWWRGCETGAMTSSGKTLSCQHISEIP